VSAKIPGEKTRAMLERGIPLITCPEILYIRDLLVSSRFMHHEPHDGYNADGPSTSYYLAMEFSDMSQAEACWTYIESDDELVKALHDPVKSSVRNSSFFLYRDIL